MCSFCGFNATLCVQRYPFAPPPLDRFVDPDAAITQRENREMTRAIGKLERRYPQLRVSVCVMELPSGVDGREFGFWYLNRCEVHDDEERQQRLHQILILVDRNDQNVSVTVGYGLDCFMDDVFLQGTLERAAEQFRAKGYASGIAAWLKIIDRELISVHREAAYAVQRWERRGGSAPEIAAEHPTEQAPAAALPAKSIPAKPRAPRPAIIFK